jgi:glycosyltransferase involved in cell wall biosynthesis
MGRFVEQKGYEYLIQAFSKLPAPLRRQSQLVLLGEGPLESELKSLASLCRLSRSVLFPGYRQDVRRILGISDAVVFSSLWEGLPIALLEAMAAGRSILATDIEAFLDVLQPGTEALLVPPADSSAMAVALETLIQDNLMRDELGRRARVRFTAEFTAFRMVEAYEQLYKKVLSRTLGSMQED